MTKYGYLGDHYPVNNVPNKRLKALHKKSQTSWKSNYLILNFEPPYINSVMVKSWDEYKFSSGTISRDGFIRTNSFTLGPTDAVTNTKVCVAFTQVSTNPNS